MPSLRPTPPRPPFNVVYPLPFQPYEGRVPPAVFVKNYATGIWDWYPADKLPPSVGTAAGTAESNTARVTFGEMLYRAEEGLGFAIICAASVVTVVAGLFILSCLFTLIG